MRAPFCTVINCMDGRVQTPVTAYLRNRFDAEHVDVITAAGPVRTLAHEPGSRVAEALLGRVDISMEAHGSTQIAVAAHHDCAGNPVSEAEQKRQLVACVELLARRYNGCEVIAIWVDAAWTVTEVDVEAG